MNQSSQKNLLNTTDKEAIYPTISTIKIWRTDQTDQTDLLPKTENRQYHLSNTSSRQSNGFSLIEVMFGLAILAFLGMATTSYMSQYSRSTRDNQSKQNAIQLSQEIIKRINIDFRKRLPPSTPPTAFNAIDQVEQSANNPYVGIRNDRRKLTIVRKAQKRISYENRCVNTTDRSYKTTSILRRCTPCNNKKANIIVRREITTLGVSKRVFPNWVLPANTNRPRSDSPIGASICFRRSAPGEAANTIYVDIDIAYFVDRSEDHDSQENIRFLSSSLVLSNEFLNRGFEYETGQ